LDLGLEAQSAWEFYYEGRELITVGELTKVGYVEQMGIEWEGLKEEVKAAEMISEGEWGERKLEWVARDPIKSRALRIRFSAPVKRAYLSVDAKLPKELTSFSHRGLKC
jgi:hypothetical protein